MKKTSVVLGVIIVVGASLWGAHWTDEKADWRQDLPINEIAVNGIERYLGT